MIDLNTSFILVEQRQRELHDAATRHRQLRQAHPRRPLRVRAGSALVRAGNRLAR